MDPGIANVCKLVSGQGKYKYGENINMVIWK